MTQPGPHSDRAVFARLNRRWVAQQRLTPDDADPSSEQLEATSAALAAYNGGRAPVVRVLATPPTHRSVVAQLWNGAVTVRSLVPYEPNPVPEELDHIAFTLAGWNDDEPPSVRVLATSSLRMSTR